MEHTLEQTFERILHHAILEGGERIEKYVSNKMKEEAERARVAEDESKEPPIIIEARHGRLWTLDSLSDSAINLEARDNHFRRTPLIEAVHAEETGAVQILLSKGANIEAVDSDRRTALHHAAKAGNLTLIQQLVNKGADCTKGDSCGSTPLHLVNLSSASYDDIAAAIKLFLQRGAKIEARNMSDKTPLHIAVSHALHDGKVVGLLLDEEASTAVRSTKRQTPLHLAALGDSEEVVRLLFKHGANVDAKDETQETPLLLAIPLRHHSIIALLLKNHAETIIQNSKLQTPLHLAALADSITDSENKTTNSSQMTRLLLKHAHEVNAQDEDGNTPLHLAATALCAEIVKLLLSNNASPSLKNKMLQTPAYLAFAAARAEVERCPAVTHVMEGPFLAVLSPILLAKGRLMGCSEADQNQEYWDEGRTLVFLSRETYKFEELPKLIIPLCTNLNYQDEAGRTALHGYARMAKVDVVRMLLDHGANPNIRNKKGRTPLHSVCWGDTLFDSNSRLEEIARLLVQHGADKRALDNEGHTPVQKVPLWKNGDGLRKILA